MVPKHKGMFSHSPIKARSEIDGKSLTLHITTNPNDANIDKFANVERGAIYFSSLMSEVNQNTGRTIVISHEILTYIS